MTLCTPVNSVVKNGHRLTHWKRYCLSTAVKQGSCEAGQHAGTAASAERLICHLAFLNEAALAI